MLDPLDQIGQIRSRVLALVANVAIDGGKLLDQIDELATELTPLHPHTVTVDSLPKLSKAQKKQYVCRHSSCTKSYKFGQSRRTHEIKTHGDAKGKSRKGGKNES